MGVCVRVLMWCIRAHMCICVFICVCIVDNNFNSRNIDPSSSYIQHNMMVTMSEQALIDCSWGYGNNGCDGGETFRSYQWIMDNECIPTEYTYGHYLQEVGGWGSL